MRKTQFEVVEIDHAHVTVDVSMINSDKMFFNATQMAKAFDKRPDDFWKQSQNQEYLSALITLCGGNKESYVITRRGRKYGGTWLHNDLGLAFARWLSPLFAVKLDLWAKERLATEQEWRQNRLAARTGYAPMTSAIAEAHDPAKFYHFSSEADMINKIVTGLSAKKFKKQNEVDDVRDALPASQLGWLDRLQRINTGLIEVGMDYKVRKAMLIDHYNKKLLIEA